MFIATVLMTDVSKSVFFMKYLLKTTGHKQKTTISIHPLFVTCFFEIRSQGQRLEQEGPDIFPHPPLPAFLGETQRRSQISQETWSLHYVLDLPWGLLPVRHHWKTALGRH